MKVFDKCNECGKKLRSPVKTVDSRIKYAVCKECSAKRFRGEGFIKKDGKWVKK